MKELRFSIQCGAPNRKALMTRRCSQCTIDHGNIEMDEISSHQQSVRSSSHSNRSLSSASANFPSHLQLPKRRSTAERTSDANKFDTLLMLAAERTSQSESRRKRHSGTTDSSSRRHLSVSPQRRDVPLLLVEQQGATNHRGSVRSQQVRFSSASGRSNEIESINPILFLSKMFQIGIAFEFLRMMMMQIRMLLMFHPVRLLQQMFELSHEFLDCDETKQRYHRSCGF